MSIENLRKKWDENCEGYKTKEVGSGVHSFISDIFESDTFFQLKKTAAKSGAGHIFVHDTESNEGGRPDFVLYIDQDITIPVEAKCFGHIEDGVAQLHRYQIGLDKQFGILTDGNEWRFYRGGTYRRVMLKDMFAKPKDFKTFWQDYIKPENYYIELFNKSGQPNLFESNIDLNIAENRKLFFDDTTRLIDNFKVKMKTIGAFGSLSNQPESEKTAVETSYAYLIQFILYKVLVDNRYLSLCGAYKAMMLRMQKYIKDKDLYAPIMFEVGKVAEYISSNIYKPFEQEQESITAKLFAKLENPSIDDIAPWLDILAYIDKYSFANLKNEIFGFIYENYLKDLYHDENKGQYFTDPAVVNFMLSEIGYDKEALTGAQSAISIIDPSCGAGTFLYSAVDRIISAVNGDTEEAAKHIENLIDKNIFGLDIEEFPLYLAEMSILMRLLPLIVNDSFKSPIESKFKIFKTKDSIAEFLDTGIDSKENKQIDLFGHLEDVALDYSSFMRDEADLTEMLESMQMSMGIRGRFDYVVGNPPYVGLNKCYQQGVDFTKKIGDKADNSLTMGNVYGVNLHSVPDIPKRYPPKPNLYAFFIALGLALLKDGGKICYIIPQTILTETDYDVLRYHLSKHATIETIVTFDGNLFIGRGLQQKRPVPTSSLIFVAKKTAPHAGHAVKIVNYKTYTEEQAKSFSEYLKSGERDTKIILQSELLKQFGNWNIIKQSDTFLDFWDAYQKNTSDFAIYYDHGMARANFNNYTFWFDVGFVIKKQFIQKEKLKENDIALITEYPRDRYKLSSFSCWYPLDAEKIEIPKASQGLDSVQLPYKIIWQKAHGKGRFYYTDKQILTNMSDQQFIASKNRPEILYLLAILNNPLTSLVLKSFFSLSNEKVGMFVAVKRIKNYIRVPKITDANRRVRDEIIKMTYGMLSLEDVKLRRIVNLNDVQMQRFTSVFVRGDNLVLKYDSGEISVPIPSDKIALVRSLFDNDTLFDNEISLSDLKDLEAIDFDLQRAVKDYIDDLVFALYFDIPIKVKALGFSKAADIKKVCEKNEFYSLTVQKE